MAEEKSRNAGRFASPLLQRYLHRERDHHTSPTLWPGGETNLSSKVKIGKRLDQSKPRIRRFGRIKIIGKAGAVIFDAQRRGTRVYSKRNLNCALAVLLGVAHEFARD